MFDSRTDQIAKLKQAIASLEEQQRGLGVDLSTSIQPLHELLAHLEQAEGAPTNSTVSGGPKAQADTIEIGGDAADRDKVESRTASPHYRNQS